ncbi:MAG: serine/threonine protein kinase [Myxococcales bacterium]|nr:serine/threonine protein kinase [Myxococcales bacterium]
MSASSSPTGSLPHIEKYELAEEIGHGGMATVYRARDLRLHRDVAVKIIHKHLRENPEVRRRFVAEARAVAKLRHPCIVEVYDVSDEADAERFLVVELIRGTTLRDLLRQHPELPAEVGACITALLCDAVDHAHQCGVIHRDIKPENVLIELPPATAETPKPPVARSASDPPPAGSSGSGSGRRDSSRRSDGEKLRVKLTDFGIAKVLDAQGVTSTGQILGSPAHMAPEQIEGGAVVPATDVFALGVLFYECMVGHLPFEGKNPAQVLRRVIEGKYEPADAERPVVGGRWGRIVGRARERDVAARLASAAAFAELVRAELAALGVTDLRGEVAEYFADPVAYRARQAAELPARLLERGESARRKGMVHAAAADFNRALAYRPDDLVIMRRVSALSAEAAWRRRALRLGAVSLFSAALGLGAFGMTRWLRTSEGAASPSAPATGERATTGPGSEPEEPPASATAPVPASAATAPPSASAAPSSAASTSPSASASASAPSSAGITATAPPTTSGEPPPRGPDTRRVTFVVAPPGAVFVLDDKTEKWQGREFPLRVGSSHTVRITMPANAKCCENLETGFTVAAPPADSPDAPLPLIFKLKTKPGTASVSGGPPGSAMTCLRAGFTAGAMPVPIVLPEASLTDTCTFTPGRKTSTWTFLAGEANVVPWPGE